MTIPCPARVLLVGLTLFLFGATGCKRNDKAAGPPKKPVISVIVKKVGRKDMPVVVRSIGRISSPATVSVKPQVTGTIAQVHFTDGQPVKKGDLLFTLDKRPFEVVRDQTRASLAEAEIKAGNADDQAKRYRSLDQTGSVSKEQVSDFEVAAKVAKATVQVASATVKNAELQVDYCEIRSPINGRAGKALVTAGNVISANQTELVVVNQLAPIEVTFSVAEQQLAAVQASLAAGKPKVTASFSGKDRRTAVGELTFVDNSVKAATGTIELKAAFANEPQILWPGQFVNLELQIGLDKNAVVAPAEAVQDGQDSPFVYLIKDGQSTEMRKVVVDRTQNEESVIRSGLQGGEQIVVDGQSRLTADSVVRITPAEIIPSVPPRFGTESTRPPPARPIVEVNDAALAPATPAPAAPATKQP